MKSDEAMAAEQSLESKLESIGADQVRRYGPTTTAPEGTPVEEVQSDQVGPARNELGQFTSTDPEYDAEAAGPEVEAMAGDVQDQGAQDPAVAAFLAKYGGDVTKALAGAVHLQRKAGEQSNEVGELRRMVDELSQLRESIQTNQPQPQMVLDQATVDWFDQQAMENPQQAVAWAEQQNNPLLVQRAIATWKEIDPYGAAVYTTNLQNQQLYQQLEQRLQSATQLPTDAMVNLALQNVKSRNPHFTNYDDVLGDTFANDPYLAQTFKQSVASGDAQQIEGAIETAYRLAVGDTLTRQALAGTAPDSTTTTTDVVEPTISEPHEAPPAATPVDQFREAFRQEAEQSRRGVFVAE